MTRAFVAVSLLIAAPALAAPTAPSAGSLVEISWSDPPSDRARVALALPADHACSSIDVDHERRVLSVSVCRSGGDSEAPGLEIQVERVERSSQPPTHMKLKTNVRLRSGTSVPIGRFDRADHPSEVLVSLR